MTNREAAIIRLTRQQSPYNTKAMAARIERKLIEAKSMTDAEYDAQTEAFIARATDAQRATTARMAAELLGERKG